MRRALAVLALLGLFFVLASTPVSQAAHAPLKGTPKTNAYATMLYMGTPRDYEFYVAARVMLGTLVRFQVDADLVVIASTSVPQHWQKTLYVVTPTNECSRTIECSPQYCSGIWI